jgi:APA family basic amino acid/polyamine antiporter
VGGVIALCGALSYGELGANMPDAGGEYIFLSRLFHPMLGFLSGWVSFIVGFSAPIAASSIGFGEYFVRAIAINESMSGIDLLLVKKGLAVSVILVFTLIHLRGIEFGSKVQNVLTILKIGLVLGLICIGFYFGQGSFEHFRQSEPLDFSIKSWQTIGLSLMWVMFAYSGWNASTYIGSEIRKPGKNLPLSLLVGTGIVMILYLGLNLLFVYAIPIDQMKGVISIGGLAMEQLFGSTAESVFSFLISFALFSSISAFIILGPRVYYAMAKKGHFFKFAAETHPKTHVPFKSIWIQAAISVFMVLTGTFEQILTFMGFALGVFPLFTILGVFILRFHQKGLIKLWGYPVVQILYMLAGLAILVLSFLERPHESSVAILTVLSGIPIFFIFRKKS